MLPVQISGRVAQRRNGEAKCSLDAPGLSFKWPRDLSATVECKVSNLSRTSRRNARLHRCIRFFAALHAVEKVLHVVDGAVAIALLIQDGIVIPRHAFAVDGEPSAIDLQGCVGAAELKAAIVD